MPDEFQRQIAKEGEAFLLSLNSLTQIVKIHSDNNALLQDTVGNFIRIVEKICENEDEILIQIQNSRFYFQQEKMLVKKANANLINRMLRYLENRGIFSLRIHAEIAGFELSEIITFARLLDRSVHQEDAFPWLVDQFEKNDIHWINIEQNVPVKEEEIKDTEELPPDEMQNKKLIVRRSYTQVLTSIKEVATKLSSDKNVGIRTTVRQVQKMVDIISEDDSLFLGISTIRIYDDYTFVHSLNVAILSMCLGKRIGLTHNALERLGLCGLFHDLGKVEISKDIVNKSGILNRDEYDELKNHSMHSARLILKLRADRDRKVKLLVPPFEHHMGYDHSGYPRVGTHRQLSLFGRIITIADVFDAITSPRVYRPTAMSPDEALGDMLSQSGTLFDPILLKVFINMMGVYPVGTLLKLDTGELGLAMQPQDHAHRERPIAQLLIEEGYEKYTKGEIADLNDQDVQTGMYLRNIIASMNPSNMGIQPAEFLL